MTTTTLDPRAWVGCLGCYNEGRLTGAWLDLDGLEDSDTLDAICTRPDHEELWCMDFDDLPSVGECSPMEAARIGRAWLEAVEECGAEPELVRVFMADGNDPATFTERYAGTADSDAGFAQEYAYDTGALHDRDEWPYTCIDWERAGAELCTDTTSYRLNGTSHYFWDA
jgi:hypothetical protein